MNDLTTPGRDPVQTLEPLIEAVTEGVQVAGWALSGFQKTTSHQFEGRWEGDETRSAYLFFHKPGVWEDVSLDIYLDETTRGLKGNLALVLDGPELGTADPLSVMEALGRAALDRLPRKYRTPVTLRFRLGEAGADPKGAPSEIRFKVDMPRAAVRAGSSAVVALATTTVRAFETLLGHPGLTAYVSTG